MEPSHTDADNSASEQEQTQEPASGSIAEVVSRLTLWARRAPKGLALVEFDSEYARRVAEEGLASNLAYADIAHHVISLPVRQSAISVIRTCLSELRDYETENGTVSILGLTTAFHDAEPLSSSLRVLNFNRENFARFSLCQIWWVTKAFAEEIMRMAPDFYSWFVVRVRLTEQVKPSALDGLILNDKTINSSAFSPLSIEEARSRFDVAEKRLASALASGTTWSEIEILSVVCLTFLLRAEAKNEAQLKADKIAHLISFSHPTEMTVSVISKNLMENAQQYVELDEERMGNILYSSNLSRVGDLNQEGKYGEAESLIQQALRYLEAKVGKEHLDFATLSALLAWNYVLQGRITEAIEQMGKMLSIRTKLLGKQHETTMLSMAQLGFVLWIAGEIDKAEPLLHNGIHNLIERNSNNGLLPGIMDAYVSLLMQADRELEAEPLRIRAQTIREVLAAQEQPAELQTSNTNNPISTD